jgi:two-component sensor histidine kinase
MSVFIRKISADLRKYFETPDTVEFKFCLESLHLQLNRAEPLGLLINEVITNCLRHAFANPAKGAIYISLETTSFGGITVLIKDSGRRIVPEFCFHKDRTLGMKLIRGLADQLQAELDFKWDGGLTVRLDFPVNEGAN